MAEGYFFAAIESLTVGWPLTDDHDSIKNCSNVVDNSWNDEEQAPEDDEAGSEDAREEERENVPSSLSCNSTE